MEKQIKAVFWFLGFLLILYLFWSALGLDSGRGGNPQESYQEDYQEENY